MRVRQMPTVSPARNRRFRCLLLPAVLLVAGGTGCARGVVTSDLHPDGSWTRTVVFKSQAPEGGGGLGTSVEDAFVLPTGPAWKVTSEKQKDELVYTATRKVARGETLSRDISIREPAPKRPPGAPAAPARKPVLLVTNTVTVREVGPGRLEYREVLHWNGARPVELLHPPAEMLQSIREVLPAELRQDPGVETVTQGAVRQFWRVLFGPGDPLLMQLPTNPELAERRIRQRMGSALEQSFATTFGARLTAEQRRAATRKLMTQLLVSADSHGKAQQGGDAGNGGPAANGKSKDQNSLVALLFTVKAPGKIVATNGERDDITGEVFWGLYSDAAALEDVVMTVTCDTKGP